MYVLCVFVIVIIYGTVDGAAGKALLCRDPDTGKFYGVNTTWPSTTFCGNYHCKLRKKNITRTEYVPSRKLNLSEHDLEMKIPKHDQLFYSMFKKVTPKDEYSLADIFTIKDKKSNLPAPEIVSKEIDNDRYLNENEIKSISSILHTLKKSDLDAIIEIYNLAQDIYKEIDKPSHNNLLTEDVTNIKHNITNQLTKHNDNKISYWYEPERGDKRFETDTVDIRIVNTNKNQESSKETLKSTTAKPLIISQNSISDPKDKDFTKPMYYYPMTAFQRVSSYIYPPATYISPYIPSPLKTQQETAKYQKIINPSFYLPYPFSYVPHRNKTQTENIYSYGNFNDNSEPTQPINNAVLINPDLENMPGISIEKVNKSNKEIESIKTPERITKIKHTHDWQTDPISAQILNEVRANADKKLLRPISLRKKITLERVGKVLNVDEITKRTKRSPVGEINDQTDDYEVYVEKSMCRANSTEPGYFRYGNMSQPFPDCCPQKIS